MPKNNRETEPKKNSGDEISRMFEDWVNKNKVANKDLNRTKRSPVQGKTLKKPADQMITEYFHGMQLKEALVRLDLIIVRLRKDPGLRFKIITGTGKHSEGIYSVLAGGIENALDDYKKLAGIQFVQMNGVFEVWI